MFNLLLSYRLKVCGLSVKTYFNLELAPLRMRIIHVASVNIYCAHGFGYVNTHSLTAKRGFEVDFFKKCVPCLHASPNIIPKHDLRI